MLYQRPPNSGFLCPHISCLRHLRSLVCLQGLHNHGSFRNTCAHQFLSKLISSISLASFPISCSVALRIIENNLYAQNIGWLGLDSYSLQLGYSHLNRSQISAHFLYSQLWVSSLVNLNSIFSSMSKSQLKIGPCHCQCALRVYFSSFRNKGKIEKIIVSV